MTGYGSPYDMAAQVLAQLTLSHPVVFFLLVTPQFCKGCMSACLLPCPSLTFSLKLHCCLNLLLPTGLGEPGSWGQQRVRQGWCWGCSQLSASSLQTSDLTVPLPSWVAPQPID